MLVFRVLHLQGAGSALLDKPNRLERIVKGMTSVLDVPLTVKLRTGITSYKNVAHHLLPRLRDWGVSLASVSLSPFMSCGFDFLVYN